MGKDILKTLEINFDKKFTCKQGFVDIEVYQIWVYQCSWFLAGSIQVQGEPSWVEIGGNNQRPEEGSRHSSCHRRVTICKPAPSRIQTEDSR